MQTLAPLDLTVSRETMDRLEAYLALLRKWNPAINLVSKSTLETAWTRHFIDSAQIFQLAPKTSGVWLDIGSGGGFPGLVCAILAAEHAPELKFTLVESDQRKATFLRTVAREVSIKAEVHAKRVEKVEPIAASIMTARALAPLSVLLGFAERHLASDGVAYFPKGENYEAELSEALVAWRFSYQKHTSTTVDASAILEIGDISRA